LRGDPVCNWEKLEQSHASGNTPSARYGHTIVHIASLNGAVLQGGFSQSKNVELNDIWFLDFASKKWTSVVCSKPRHLHFHAATSYGDEWLVLSKDSVRNTSASSGFRIIQFAYRHPLYLFE
jgi:hypothetical protein